MLKSISNKISKNTLLYTFLRKIIENNFKAVRKVLINEFYGNTGRILDLACGIGEFSVYFDKDKYVGVDLSEKYIEYGRKKFDKNLIVGDALKLDFKNKEFDSVLVIGFLHHLDDDTVEKVLKEVSRVLK